MMAPQKYISALQFFVNFIFEVSEWPPTSFSSFQIIVVVANTILNIELNEFRSQLSNELF